MNRSFYDKLSIVATAILLCVVVILTLTSAFKKTPQNPTEPEAPTYAVSFYEDDKETLIKKVNVKKGDKAEIPSPTKEPTTYITYTFLNWTLSDGTDAKEALESVQSDLSVYAKFEEKTRSYNITFYQTKDSKIPLASPFVEAGQKFDVTALSFEPPYDEDYNFVFECWVDKDGNDMTESFENVLCDLVVYAKYKKELKTYTLTLKSPYIMVKEGDGTFVGQELAGQMKLYKDSIITIKKVPPEDGREVIYMVQGANLIDEQAGTYRVYSNVNILVALS